MNNTTGSVWQPVTVTATGLTTVTGNVFVARTPEVFSYDLDGNMTSDGRWNYTWDAENRLIKVESRPDTPSRSWRRIEWTYDALGRRIQQITSIWTNNAWFVLENLKFVSDPMLFGRHIVELNGTNNTLVRSYVWGLDLSGTMDGAGGVGGLTWVTLHTASGAASGTHFVCYDGNGNIVSLVSSTTGDVTARYEYGPFGEPVRVSGPAAALNPFRFSTKRTDSTADLVLYEYRVYSPTLGRWPNRDPLGELGGLNLYGFVQNDPIQGVDLFGLTTGTISVLHSTPVNKFGHAGWSIRLRWTPPKEWTCCDRCTKVIWVQNYSWVMQKTRLGIYVSQDWTKDWDETDYTGNSDLWECSKWPRGNRLDNADMWDDPEIYGTTWATALTMDFTAESRVKCIEGPDKGKIYGGVLWGYRYEAGWGWPFSKVTGGVKGIW